MQATETVLAKILLLHSSGSGFSIFNVFIYYNNTVLQCIADCLIQCYCDTLLLQQSHPYMLAVCGVEPAKEAFLRTTHLCKSYLNSKTCVVSLLKKGVFLF